MSNENTPNSPPEKLDSSSTPTAIANFARNLKLIQFRRAVEKHYDDWEIRGALILLLNDAAKQSDKQK